jgi:hypothetical protein
MWDAGLWGWVWVFETSFTPTMGLPQMEKWLSMKKEK